jgi:hypothetical protein
LEEKIVRKTTKANYKASSSNDSSSDEGGCGGGGGPNTSLVCWRLVGRERHLLPDVGGGVVDMGEGSSEVGGWQRGRVWDRFEQAVKLSKAGR